MVMDYLLNPLICTILCSKLKQNTFCRECRTGRLRFSTRRLYGLNLPRREDFGTNQHVLAAGMTIVVIIFSDS